MKTLNEWLSPAATNKDATESLNESLFDSEVTKKIEQIEDLTRKIEDGCKNLSDLAKFKKNIIATKKVYDEVVTSLDKDRMAIAAINGMTWHAFRTIVWKAATASVSAFPAAKPVEDLLKATKWLVPALETLKK
jgi:cytoplasmic iron level regulating protein YaaA (DUF328/UPF0246 family)